jgi:hypothetical protein
MQRLKYESFPTKYTEMELWKAHPEDLPLEYTIRYDRFRDKWTWTVELRGVFISKDVKNKNEAILASNEHYEDARKQEFELTSGWLLGEGEDGWK